MTSSITIIFLGTNKVLDTVKNSTSKGCYSKFVKASEQNSKLKSITIDPRGKSSVSSQPNSSNIVKSLPKASSSRHSSIGLLPIHTIVPTCHHCGQLGLLRPLCEKLTTHPFVKINVNTFSSSPPCTTP